LDDKNEKCKNDAQAVNLIPTRVNILSTKLLQVTPTFFNLSPYVFYIYFFQKGWDDCTMLVLALHSSTAMDFKKFGLACDELLDVTIDFQPKHCD
jgi:hypothetical protein